MAHLWADSWAALPVSIEEDSEAQPYTLLPRHKIWLIATGGEGGRAAYCCLNIFYL